MDPTHPRTADKFGRGGGQQSSFELDDYLTLPPAAGTKGGGGTELTALGVLSKEEVYERARYFLERVIPHAEKHGVQLACHLGIEMWNYPVLEGCERFANLVDSPMHGFNFCIGTAMEGLKDPAAEICPIVAHFTRRGKVMVAAATNSTAAIFRGCSDWIEC